MLCFFFKQKTAYEMRISDWSSDVCSSDLARKSAAPAMPKCKRSPASSLKLISPRGSKPRAQPHDMDMPGIEMPGMEMPEMKMPQGHDMKMEDSDDGQPSSATTGDGQSGVQGQRVEVREDLGGWRTTKKKN